MERVSLRGSKNCKMQDITVFCSDGFSDPHKYVRSKLQCEETGYETGSCIFVLINKRCRLKFELK
jgi:hypothetical protein